MTVTVPSVVPRGIIASLHTPFGDDGELDLPSLRRLIRHVADSGCTGILVPAVAGEVGALTAVERRALVAEAGACCGAGLAMIAGVSAPELETSRRLAEEAAAAGASMLLWQAPPTITVASLVEAVTVLAGAAGLPVMLQDLDWQGVGIPPAVIAEAARAAPALVAVKVETVPAGPKYSAIRAAAPHLHLSGGWAAMQMMDGLERGLDAFVPSGMLPVYVRIFALWERGEHDAARRLFEQALPVLAFSNQHIAVSIAFWKRYRVRLGQFGSARARPPVEQLDPIMAAEADRLIERAMPLDAAATS